MIKLVKEYTSGQNIQIIKDVKSFDAIKLSFKEEVFDLSTKTLYIGGKENYEVEEILDLFGKIMSFCKQKEIKEATIDVTDFTNEQLQQIVLGLILGSYNVKAPHHFVCAISLIVNDTTVDISQYVNLAQNMNMTKTLSNAPANFVTPQYFVEYAKKIFKDTKVAVEIFDEEKILDLKMGGLYGVGRGSANRPVMLKLNYKPTQDEEVIALVGKGVTFDTGGYSLKPAAGMENMRGDMGGASSMLAVFKTLVDQNINKNVVAMIPLCENRIDNQAILPGDVITAYDGTTIEVINTDAEGRLILADALSYVVKNEKVKAVFDMATLTGAAANAFGNTITPIVTNDENLWQKLQAASQKSGEKFVNIPCFKEHRKMIDSKIADLKNTGGRVCGIMTSAVFLQHFVNNTPWIHFDIAGTHHADSPLYAHQQSGTICGAIETLYYLVKEL